MARFPRGRPAVLPRVPGAVARVRWPRDAAASEGQRCRVPVAGPLRARRGRGIRRRRGGAATRVLPRRRRQSPGGRRDGRGVRAGLAGCRQRGIEEAHAGQGGGRSLRR